MKKRTGHLFKRGRVYYVRTVIKNDAGKSVVVQRRLSKDGEPVTT